MDFIGGLPRVGKQDTILVVIDRHTKYAHFLLLGHPYNASDVAEVFIAGVIKLHGFPEAIISDRDKLFLSHFWKELFKRAGTKLKYSTAFHPQTDGQTEVTNRCLEVYLRCFVGDYPKSWPKWISWAELWFNTNYNSSIGMTPYKALYGRDPNPIIRGPAIPSNIEEVNVLYEERDALLGQLHSNLTPPQQRMKKQADKHRRDLTLEVGDWVYLKACPYRWKSLAVRRNEKSNKVVRSVLMSLGALLLVLCGVGFSFFVFCRSKRKEENQSEETQTGVVFSIWSYDGKMMFENIIEATENFDEKYLIEVGSQGNVYKAKLLDGLVVAVKKLHIVTNDDAMSYISSKAFTSEIETLTEIKHRNIIKLHGFCSHSKFSFLVYKFMEGGSLDQVLQNETKAIAFDWEKRVNVVKGVANALSYMHHDCSPPIIHRDISSKNVLLDHDYEAHDSDFGTAKFLKPDSHSWTAFAGTFGYAAPEFAHNGSE